MTLKYFLDAKPGSSICNMKEGKEKDLPSFWVPSLTPESKPTLIKKPVGTSNSKHYFSVVYPWQLTFRHSIFKVSSSPVGYKVATLSCHFFFSLTNDSPISFSTAILVLLHVALALGWPVFACIWVLTIGRPACNLTH
jgi:hypothetical protein